MMRERKICVKVITLLLAVMVGITGSLATADEASAAVKKPTTVKNLKVVSKSSSAVRIKWKKQKNIKVKGKSYKVKYKIAYKQAGTKTWKYKKTSKNAYSVKKLKSGKKYQFRVKAYYTAGGKTYSGKYSKTKTATTKKLKPIKLRKPEIFFSEKGSVTQYVRWRSAPDWDECEKYGIKGKIAYRKAGAKKWKYKTVANHDARNSGCNLEGLSPKTKYQVKVMLYYKIGDRTYKSGYSKAKTFTTRGIKKKTITIAGKKITVTEGRTVAIPAPDGSRGYTVKVSEVKTDEYGTHIIGKTSDGLDYSRTASGTLVVGDRTDYEGYGLSGRGREIEGANGATVYWTCDGTRPEPGQKDVTGACKYTRYTYDYYHKMNAGFNLVPIDGYKITQLRGTTKPGEKDELCNIPGIDDERIIWFRVFKNGRCIVEYMQHYNPDGYDYNPSRLVQVCIDAIEELNSFDKEFWSNRVYLTEAECKELKERQYEEKYGYSLFAPAVNNQSGESAGAAPSVNTEPEEEVPPADIETQADEEQESEPEAESAEPAVSGDGTEDTGPEITEPTQQACGICGEECVCGTDR